MKVLGYSMFCVVPLAEIM